MNISVHVRTVTHALSYLSPFLHLCLYLFYIISQANTCIEAKINEAVYIKKYTPKLSNQIYHCGSSFVLNIFLRPVLYLLNQILFVSFFINVLDVNKLR